MPAGVKMSKVYQPNRMKGRGFSLISAPPSSGEVSPQRLLDSIDADTFCIYIVTD